MALNLFTSQDPGAQDLTDGAVLMLGTYITPSVDGFVTALRYRFPESSQPEVRGALFRTSDGVKIGGDVAFTAPVLDAWNEVALAAPVPVLAGEQLCPAFRLLRYTASFDGVTLPITNGPLSAPADGGRYGSADPDGTVQFPTAVGACYFADLVFEPVEPAEGEASFSLGLAPAGAGRTAARGAAGLQLDLALGSTGGEPGRPVSAFPWTPRPVRSFLEVTP